MMLISSLMTSIKEKMKAKQDAPTALLPVVQAPILPDDQMYNDRIVIQQMMWRCNAYGKLTVEPHEVSLFNRMVQKYFNEQTEAKRA